jgi:hypothetical protein
MWAACRAVAGACVLVATGVAMSLLGWFGVYITSVDGFVLSIHVSRHWVDADFGCSSNLSPMSAR